MTLDLEPCQLTCGKRNPSERCPALDVSNTKPRSVAEHFQFSFIVSIIPTFYTEGYGFEVRKTALDALERRAAVDW
jgi:hypothetical protein